MQITKGGLVKVLHKDNPLFGKAGAMKVEIFEDIWGSWGGMTGGERTRCSWEKVLESWTVTRHAVLQKGARTGCPVDALAGEEFVARSYLLVAQRWGRRSRQRSHVMERTERAPQARPPVRRPALDAGSRFRNRTPAARALAERQSGSVAAPRQAGLGFISDVLGDIDATPDRIHVTIARASRYADDVPTPAGEAPWRPAVDCGELKFQFFLTTADANLNHLSEQMIHAPLTLTIPPHPGHLGPAGSLAELQPRHVTLLSASALEKDRLQIRIQNQSQATTEASLVLAGKKIKLGTIKPFEIKTLTVNAPAVQEKVRAKPAQKLVASRV